MAEGLIMWGRTLVRLVPQTASILSSGFQDDEIMDEIKEFEELTSSKTLTKQPMELMSSWMRNMRNLTGTWINGLIDIPYYNFKFQHVYFQVGKFGQILLIATALIKVMLLLVSFSYFLFRLLHTESQIWCFKQVWSDTLPSLTSLLLVR